VLDSSVGQMIWESNGFPYRMYVSRDPSTGIREFAENRDDRNIVSCPSSRDGGDPKNRGAQGNWDPA